MLMLHAGPDFYRRVCPVRAKQILVGVGGQIVSRVVSKGLRDAQLVNAEGKALVYR
jgi:hypothetical protein